MNTPLDSFETGLLTRLREQVDQPVVQPRQPHRRLLMGAALAMGAAAALVVLVPGVGTNAAYSVQEGNAGTITVQVRRLEDAKGLEAALAEYGVAADVTYLPRRQQCASGRFAPVDRSLSGMGVTMGEELLRVTLPPGTVRKGETFVMAVSGEAVPPSPSKSSEDGVTDLGGFAGWTDFDVTNGLVRPCRPVPGIDD